MTFTVGPLAIGGIAFKFPGPNLHLEDVQLSGPARLGEPTIITGAGEWRGTLTGHFQGDFPTGILLTSQVVLHGPGQQLLKADCDEISPSNSETLACSGEPMNPGP